MDNRLCEENHLFDDMLIRFRGIAFSNSLQIRNNYLLSNFAVNSSKVIILHGKNLLRFLLTKTSLPYNYILNGKLPSELVS